MYFYENLDSVFYYKLPPDFLSLNQSFSPSYFFDFYVTYGDSTYHSEIAFSLTPVDAPEQYINLFYDGINYYSFVVPPQFSDSDFQDFIQVLSFYLHNDASFLSDSEGNPLTSTEESTSVELEDIYNLLNSWYESTLPDPSEGLPSEVQEEPGEASQPADSSIVSDLLFSLSESVSEINDISFTDSVQLTDFESFVSESFSQLNEYSFCLVLLLAAFLSFYVFRGFKHAIMRVEGSF